MISYDALVLEQVIYIHDRIIEMAGGKQGVRDYTLLHSALERCKATFAGEDLYPTLGEKASALMHSLVKNHAFVDGNKRTAYAMTIRFLETNGQTIKATQKQIIAFCLKIDNHDWDVSDIHRWILAHVESIL